MMFNVWRTVRISGELRIREVIFEELRNDHVHFLSTLLIVRNLRDSTTSFPGLLLSLWKQERKKISFLYDYFPREKALGTRLAVSRISASICEIKFTRKMSKWPIVKITQNVPKIIFYSSFLIIDFKDILISNKNNK